MLRPAFNQLNRDGGARALKSESASLPSAENKNRFGSESSCARAGRGGEAQPSVLCVPGKRCGRWCDAAGQSSESHHAG
jgi:hypothetical protein